MTTLISPQQVRQLAFGSERLPACIPSEADITAAARRYLLPVVGEGLYEALLGGAYADFTQEYLAAPLALLTRLVVQARLDVRTDSCGTSAPRSSWTQPAPEESLRALRQSLMVQARTLLRRAAEHLDAHRGAFAEYDPGKSSLKRCCCDGGLVQIL